jgi:glycosyltransferase involved in cell wall biosynthesis
MPRILHVTTVGVTARVFLLPLFQRLKREGCDMWFACTPDDDAGGVAAQGFSFFPCRISRRIAPSDLHAVAKLRRFIRRERFQLVHTHTAKAGFVGRLAAWLAGTPCIVHTYHGMPIHDYQLRPVSWFYTMLERWIGKRTTHFIAVTDKIARDLVRLGIASEDGISRIYNGLDFSRFNPDAGRETRAQRRAEWNVAEDDLVIGAVTRLVPHKGLEDLLDAFAQLAQSHPSAVLVIAGDGPLRPALATRAAHLGITDRLRWLGWQDDVPGVLSGFDVFCLPTLREGFGYVFLEAQAMGVPVVATRIDPLTETMKDGETALLVPPQSPAALVAALTAVLDDAGLRARLVSNARHRVRALFDQRIQLDQLSALYARLLS